MSASNLTPSQVVWARFYSVLHEEVLKLEALAQKKTDVVSPVSETKDTTSATQRQQVKASVNGNDTKQS